MKKLFSLLVKYRTEILLVVIPMLIVWIVIAILIWHHQPAKYIY